MFNKNIKSSIKLNKCEKCIEKRIDSIKNYDGIIISYFEPIPFNGFVNFPITAYLCNSCIEKYCRLHNYSFTINHG